MFKKAIFLFVLSVLIIPLVHAKEFKIEPNTIGVGLQKDNDIVDFESSDEDRCVLYHLGNPWATNVTAWIVTEGDLANYFTKNRPNELFVPSGTFRYNSSCCLLPIEACFKFPYVLEETAFAGKVRSAYGAADRPGMSSTGSATGSSVSYSLIINIRPAKEVVLDAGETKCFDFYKVGKKCFSAPRFVLADATEVVDVDGHKITLSYKNNSTIIYLLAGAIIAMAILVFYKYRKHGNYD